MWALAAKMPKKTGKEETSLLFLLCPGFLLEQLLPQVSLLKAGGPSVPLPWVLGPCPWQSMAALFRIFIWA